MKVRTFEFTIRMTVNDPETHPVTVEETRAAIQELVDEVNKKEEPALLTMLEFKETTSEQT